jgi:predicted SnoaL-like aldol condensation-catalyzing enzyme
MQNGVGRRHLICRSCSWTAQQKTCPRRFKKKNKALLIDGFNTLFNKRDFARAEKYWSSNYNQRSAHIEPAGMVSSISSTRYRPGLCGEPGIMMAESDYVMVHRSLYKPGRQHGTLRSVHRSRELAHPYLHEGAL